MGDSFSVPRSQFAINAALNKRSCWVQSWGCSQQRAARVTEICLSPLLVWLWHIWKEERGCPLPMAPPHCHSNSQEKTQTHPFEFHGIFIKIAFITGTRWQMFCFPQKSGSGRTQAEQTQLPTRAEGTSTEEWQPQGTARECWVSPSPRSAAWC